MANTSRSLKDNPGFQRYFKQHLKPIEAELEACRKAARAQRNNRVIGALMGWGSCIALVVFWLRPQAELGWWIFGFTMLVMAVCMAVWAFAPVLAHIGRIKEQVLPRLMPFFGGFQYQWSPELSLSQFGSSKVLPRHNKPFVDELIEGVYSGVPVRAIELRLRDERRVSRAGETGSSTETTEVFRGLLTETTVDQDFPGVTLVGTAGEFKNYFRIDDEDELHQQDSAAGFDIYTSEHSVSPLLTPELLQQLRSIVTLFEATKLMASFSGTKIILMLEHEGDFFEISTGQSTDLMRDADRIKDQVDKIFEIVDRLGFSGPEAGSPALAAVPAAGVPDVAFAVDDSRYDVGGWGCLGALAMWLLATAGFATLLESRVDLLYLLPWSAGGGLLAALGLFQLSKAVRQKSPGGFVFALMLLGGAAWILYAHTRPAPDPVSQPAGPTSQIQQAQTAQVQTAQPEPAVALPVPVTNWLEPPSESGILRSSVEIEGDLRHGETARVTIRIANNTPEELNLELEAGLDSLSYLVDVSHGGQLAGENTERSRDVIWNNLILPSRRVGRLEFTILIEAIYNTEVWLNVIASDSRMDFRETLSVSKRHEYSDGDPSGNMWFAIVLIGMGVSIIGGFLGQRLPERSLARQILTRGSLGFISLTFASLGGLLLWNAYSTSTAYVPTQCEVLDVRTDGSLTVAARYDSPSGSLIQTGTAGNELIESFKRGAHVPCWHHNTQHERLLLGNTLDSAGLVIGSIMTILALALGWLAVRRRGVPPHK